MNGEPVGTTTANRLAHETSPYLLQHADNPVDWHPWDSEALDLARETGTPILLSIGYTACHWCHVMEHESFQDHETAAFMNEHFVNIKVDREERPDLDKIYQVAHQILSQRPGGWPLTIVMDPVHHVPFFAGTYFPDQPRHGMPAFIEVLKRVIDFYETHKDGKLTTHIAGMKQAVAQLQSSEAGDVDMELLDQAARELASAYDTENGGFGGAPKFPQPTNLALCLRLWRRSLDQARPRDDLLDMTRHTLASMAAGGLFDHVGGGFYRYAVDTRWSIPHFEKMLYDNAQLLALYTDAHAATDQEEFAEVARRTGRWIMAEMQSPEGGYYSSLDADSEGEEGRYYVWTEEEIRSVLDDREWNAWRSRFGLAGGANFDGKWHLNIDKNLDQVAADTGLDPSKVSELLESARDKLAAVRTRRVRPQRDEKILTSWNALMIRAMARAGSQLDEPAFIDSAVRALDFVRDHLWQDGRLRAAAKDGTSRLNAYLDDHVFLIDALLTVSECQWQSARIRWAIELAEILLARFEDSEAGGMFFTSNDHEALLYRDKPSTDDSTPSGNGAAARVLMRLGHLLAEPKYLRAGERVLRALSGIMRRHPSAHGTLMEALCEYHEPVETIVMRGPDAQTTQWRSLCTDYRPDRQVFAIPESTNEELPGIIADMTNRGDVTAYVCRGTACSEPITDLSDFERHLARS